MKIDRLKIGYIASSIGIMIGIFVVPFYTILIYLSALLIVLGITLIMMCWSESYAI